MSKFNRLSPFSFAEIYVAAPWAVSILTNNRDNDRGEMLQRNRPDDEWSALPSGTDYAAIERSARQQRARVLGDAVKRLVSALRQLVPVRA